MVTPESLTTVDGIIDAIRDEAEFLLRKTGTDENYSCVADLLEKAIKKEREAALASPARNCDRTGCTSYAAAVAMHLAACGPSAKGGERELVEWLLAPAKQVKGGAE